MTVQQQYTRASAIEATILLSACGTGSQDAAVGGMQSSSAQQLVAPVSLEDAERLSAGATHVAGLNADGTVFA